MLRRVTSNSSLPFARIRAHMDSVFGFSGRALLSTRGFRGRDRFFDSRYAAKKTKKSSSLSSSESLSEFELIRTCKSS